MHWFFISLKKNCFISFCSLDDGKNTKKILTRVFWGSKKGTSMWTDHAINIIKISDIFFILLHSYVQIIVFKIVLSSSEAQISLAFLTQPSTTRDHRFCLDSIRNWSSWRAVFEFAVTFRAILWPVIYSIIPNNYRYSWCGEGLLLFFNS